MSPVTSDRTPCPAADLHPGSAFSPNKLSQPVPRHSPKTALSSRKVVSLVHGSSLTGHIY